ncbi:spermidine synthase [Parapusillimonas granuli]|uniref:Fused MFS/spermidine synthase n=1 Tax=Parapusillimonas granuli TaxID=380911 RepID=A0A853FWU9_9BURK|nr:fused MFS/spermidine synthase [Parapusillimonas granuli]MBB5214529.1 spermidine synthase [Parapusillimonas granuli]MEB2398222.1 fused MFS/spermidine synthase [Alcaligenaceae bacterium]NYT49063.1 fused MFS/spermidine synthase [Parapusillimonas granuli]
MKPARPLTLLASAIAAVLVSVALLRFFAPEASGARLLHTEPSEFAPVLVFEEFGERCMNFNTMKDYGRQTCMRIDDPDLMVFAYTRMMTSALFVKPDPHSVLFVGLGGATLPKAFAKILPGAMIHTVEIDPAVLRVAERYFGYRQGPRQRVFVEDGRAFIERARREGRRYDMIMLDAFDVDYIPAHLLTREFLEHVRAILSDDGVLVSNSFTASRMYERESATYAAVFGDFFNLRSGIAGNRVIIATKAALPDDAALARNAQALAGRLAPFGIKADEALGRYSRSRDWDPDAPVLTD